jgi:hypothetical protein
MCHNAKMENKSIIKTVLISTLVLGALPAAIAQSEDAVPYEITFSGSHYPANLESVSYPYIAASLLQDGECQINMVLDENEQLVSMSIASCSNAAFEEAARRFVSTQDLNASSGEKLTAHTLQINWDIDDLGPNTAAYPITIASAE